MKTETLIHHIKMLPPEIQREVADFVAFLSARHASQSARPIRRKKSILQTTFVGMWANRQQMEQSVRWVRKLRRTNWQ